MPHDASSCSGMCCDVCLVKTVGGDKECKFLINVAIFYGVAH